MNLAKAIREIQHAGDTAFLLAVRNAANERIKVLNRRRYEEIVAKAWGFAKTLRPGDEIHCNASGRFLGGHVQRGTRATFHQLQPRKGIVWLKIGDRLLWFGQGPWANYDFRRTPPAGDLTPVQEENK